MRKAYPNEIFHAARRINSAYDAKKINEERIKEKNRARRASGGSAEAYDYYKDKTKRHIKPGQKKAYGIYDIDQKDYDRLVDIVVRGEKTAVEAVNDYLEDKTYGSGEYWTPMRKPNGNDLVVRIETDAQRKLARIQNKKRV